MANYANQKTIIIKQDDIDKIAHQKDSNEAFIRALKWEILMKYEGVLSGNEFKILFYIMKWAGQGYYYYSPADIYIRLNIGEDTARKSINRFVELGILEQSSARVFQINLNPPGLDEIYRKELAERAIKKKKLLPEDDNTAIV